MYNDTGRFAYTGAVILFATNQLYIWGAEDISDRSQKTPDILNTIHNFFEHAKNQNLNVVAMVTDSALAYASTHILDYFQCDVANFFDIAYAFGYVAQQYENDINGFEFAAIDQKEISKVAQKLYSIKVNSTPYECLFSRMKWFQNPRRNHLKKEHLDNAEKICKTVTANRIIDSNNKLTTTSYDITNVQNCHPAEHKGSKIELQYLFKHALSQPSFVCTLQQDIENNFVLSNN
ncbi:13342_t:CDS:2 [Cetraspora pellucida]|uniref:13342_t:CDS:1 n=1 Tax=Cetraspora pellucida TaxID=1433469 RepID=A0A9N8ZBQ0_9GLOM|nr:13342_t:CDS:2 [Cetraspora pellucida]